MVGKYQKVMVWFKILHRLFMTDFQQIIMKLVNDLFMRNNSDISYLAADLIIIIANLDIKTGFIDMRVLPSVWLRTENNCAIYSNTGFDSARYLQ